MGFDIYKEGNNMLYEKLINKKKNVIFGAGVVGKLLMETAHNLNIKIDTFLVNDGHKSENNILGVPVVEVSNFEVNKEDCNIFIAVRSELVEILKPLKEKGFDELIHFDYIKDICFLLKIFYQDYFEKKGIELNHKDIQFNNCKLINPFNKDIDYLFAWLLEVGDIILPKYMNDYSKINDGYFEFENVYLQEDDIVIDCGANIGLFSAVAASEGCKVYAFEPIPKTIEYLNEMKTIYNENICICPYALSDTIGTTKFSILDNNISASSMLDMELNKNDYSIDVDVLTLDEYVMKNNLKRVDFIKADIEGAERHMLNGAKKVLQKFSPKISICTYHLKDDPIVLENIIKEANPKYVVKHNWKKIYAYVPE